MPCRLPIHPPLPHRRRRQAESSRLRRRPQAPRLLSLPQQRRMRPSILGAGAWRSARSRQAALRSAQSLCLAATRAGPSSASGSPNAAPRCAGLSAAYSPTTIPGCTSYLRFRAGRADVHRRGAMLRQMSKRWRRLQPLRPQRTEVHPTQWLACYRRVAAWKRRASLRRCLVPRAPLTKGALTHHPRPPPLLRLDRACRRRRQFQDRHRHQLVDAPVATHRPRPVRQCCWPWS